MRKSRYHSVRLALNGVYFALLPLILCADLQERELRDVSQSEYYSSPVTLHRALVLAVTEPDVVKVRWTDTGNEDQLRLWGVDAPEGDQPGGELAGNSLYHLVNGQVSVRVTGADKQGHVVGEVFKQGLSVNVAHIERGYAWYCAETAPEAGYLADLQREAEVAQRGIWSNGDVIPPWHWRR